MRYRLVVEGELGPRFSDAFSEMQVEAHEGRTAITGTIKNQAHLHGLIDTIASLGIKLVSVSPEKAKKVQRSSARSADGPPGA
jgi:hypothetical protein